MGTVIGWDLELDPRRCISWPYLMADQKDRAEGPSILSARRLPAKVLPAKNGRPLYFCPVNSQTNKKVCGFFSYLPRIFEGQREQVSRKLIFSESSPLPEFGIQFNGVVQNRDEITSVAETGEQGRRRLLIQTKRICYSVALRI